jgi:hypothetical protein
MELGGSWGPVKQSSVASYLVGFRSRGGGAGVAGCRGCLPVLRDGSAQRGGARFSLPDTRQRGKPRGSQRWPGSGASRRAAPVGGWVGRDAPENGDELEALGMSSGGETKERWRSCQKVAREGVV